MNATGKKLVFPAECGFAGNNLNVKSLKIISSASPFSNYPMKCGACDAFIWRFDFQKHYKNKHEGEDCPPDAILSQAEKNILQHKSAKSKLKMSKKDFDRLSDEELKLFSYTDFWSVKKHTWASGDAWRFGKRKSTKLKELFGAENFV